MIRERIARSSDESLSAWFTNTEWFRQWVLVWVWQWIRRSNLTVWKSQQRGLHPWCEKGVLKFFNSTCCLKKFKKKNSKEKFSVSNGIIFRTTYASKRELFWELVQRHLFTAVKVCNIVDMFSLELATGGNMIFEFYSCDIVHYRICSPSASSTSPPTVKISNSSQVRVKSKKRIRRGLYVEGTWWKKWRKLSVKNFNKQYLMS